MDTLLLNSDGSPMSVIPLSLISWQESIRLVFLDKVHVIDVYDNWSVHSARCAMAVPSVIMSKQFYDKAYKVKFTKQALLYRDAYSCCYCRKTFAGTDLTYDHVVPKSIGGLKTWDNIVLACRSCNHSRGNNTAIKPFKKPHQPTYYEMINMRKQYPIFLKQKSWNGYLQWDPKLIHNKPIHESKFKFDEK